MVKNIGALRELSRAHLFHFMEASQLSLLHIQQEKIGDILARYAPGIF